MSKNTTNIVEFRTLEKQLTPQQVRQLLFSSRPLPFFPVPVPPDTACTATLLPDALEATT